MRGAAWVLAPTAWLALTALGRGAALVPLVLALAGPGAVAAAATRARHVVSGGARSWPLTLAPFFLRGATGDGLLLGALGCVGSAGVALFYEEPRGGGVGGLVFCGLLFRTAQPPARPGPNLLASNSWHRAKRPRRA